MRKLVIGDIHGNYKGFMQCLERCNFDSKNDLLISLGDVVDGHSQSYEVVEELLKIKNRITIKGNHDDWFDQWIKTGVNPANWKQGQKATGESYLKNYNPELAWFEVAETPGMGKYYIETIKSNHIPDRHIEFFDKQLPYYIDEDNNLFIHGGFNRHYPLDGQEEFTFWWDRDLWGQALSFKGMKSELQAGFKPKFNMVGGFKEVFIGHTTTELWGETTPMNAANIWNLDTGGGWFGKVSIMDVDTKEYWQSDVATELYPEFKGR